MLSYRRFFFLFPPPPADDATPSAPPAGAAASLAALAAAALAAASASAAVLAAASSASSTTICDARSAVTSALQLKRMKRLLSSVIFFTSWLWSVLNLRHTLSSVTLSTSFASTCRYFTRYRVLAGLLMKSCGHSQSGQCQQQAFGAGGDARQARACSGRREITPARCDERTRSHLLRRLHEALPLVNVHHPATGVQGGRRPVARGSVPAAPPPPLSLCGQHEFFMSLVFERSKEAEAVLPPLTSG